MKVVWKINGQGTHRSLAVALNHAQRKFPAVVFGEPHQGPTGRIRVVGKTPNETDDCVVIERHGRYY